GGVPAQQIGVAVTAVDLTGLALGLRQAGVQPAAEGVTLGALNDGGGVVVAQGGVDRGQILTRQTGEILGRGGAGYDRKGQGGGGDKVAFHSEEVSRSAVWTRFCGVKPYRRGSCQPPDGQEKAARDALSRGPVYSPG